MEIFCACAIGGMGWKWEHSAMRNPKFISLAALLLSGFTGAFAHVGNHPSVHDTVEGIKERMKRELEPEALRRLDAGEIEAFLLEKERAVLGREHVSFRVDVPVTVKVVRPADDDPPFWLEEREFERVKGIEWRESGIPLELWRKDFNAGWIGLGVNSLTGGGMQYVVLLEPREEGASITVSDLYPGQLRTARLEDGVRVYRDEDTTFENVPSELEGELLIQTQYSQRNDARLVNLFRFTNYPSSPQPDQIVLTWSGDPATTQTIQWRTSTNVAEGFVLYTKKSLLNPLAPGEVEPVRLRARTAPLEDASLVNDPVCHRHTAVLENLEPGTTYTYTVGNEEHGWSEPAEFRTAPGKTEPFSFIYMGDAQNGLDRWGTLLKNAYREQPNAAFYIMAGDLIDRGADRGNWDSFFHNAAGIYDRRQLVPAIGNHECQGGHPQLYLDLFHLRENGPSQVEPERAYSFKYSNALFVILDSNIDPASQTAWLEEQLAQTDAVWKFVVYHHPAYSSAPRRDNKEIRELWTPLFDKYHVDLALQGHDHAYLRTYPIKGEEPVDSPAEGTIYIVSVSGTKYYGQDPRDYTEFGMTNVSTYQVLDIQISGNRLVYRAYDIDGNVRDEFVIEKRG